MKIEIYSRKAIMKRLQEGALKNTAVVSFYDPPSSRTPADYAPVDYGDLCDMVFLVEEFDIDIEVLSEYGLTFDTYLSCAPELAKFIKLACAEGMDIICQCEYGQSRSAACAAAIREYYYSDGISVFADYRYYPNQMIFNKLLEALNETE